MKAPENGQCCHKTVLVGHRCKGCPVTPRIKEDAESRMPSSADALADTLSLKICARNSWLVFEFNGDFNVINWEKSQKKLKLLIKRELEKMP